MAAVALYMKDNLSQTDTECQWSNPHKKPRLLESCVKELHNLHKSKLESNAVTLNSSDKEHLLKELHCLEAFGVYWLHTLSESNSQASTVSNSAIKILKSRLLPNSVLDLQNIRQHLAKTSEEIHEISKLTIGQRRNAKWFEHRKFVLTSSTFGKILHQVKINRFPVSFFKMLHGMYKTIGSKPIKFGQDNEITAIQKYKEITGNNVVETGLHLLSCGFIGGSPDGLIGNDGVLEVKCSYKQHKTLQSFTDLAGTLDFCLEVTGDKLSLKRSHNYYHQVQGNLHITGRSFCDFFIWSPIEHFLERIYLDLNWSSNINVLDTFYFSTFLTLSLQKIPNLELN